MISGCCKVLQTETNYGSFFSWNPELNYHDKNKTT